MSQQKWQDLYVNYYIVVILNDISNTIFINRLLVNLIGKLYRFYSLILML